jgi:pseudaminic acid biosynthesis-associated methylase
LINNEDAWISEFGKSYTDRNNLDTAELNALYANNFGVERLELNREFLADIDSSVRILEVGSNVGNQLQLLQSMGFNDLWGIEISEYALNLARKQTNNINIVKGSALDIPFKDRYFDLVYTSTVLIHIHPKDIPIALNEIYRTCNRYIWCYEYFANSETEIEYRGKTGLLWKNNFSKMFLERFPDLTMIKERRLKYKNNDNVDAMFLLKRNS